jgi:nitrate reductase NapD
VTLHRRSLLGAGPAEPGGHVASLVVQCRPEQLEAVVPRLEALSHVEVPLQDVRGKLVVLLDLPNENELLTRITEIETLPGVISATLVYHGIVDD